MRNKNVFNTGTKGKKRERRAALFHTNKTPFENALQDNASMIRAGIMDIVPDK